MPIIRVYLSALSLLTGISIYCLYRSTSLLGHRVLEWIGWSGGVARLRSMAQEAWPSIYDESLLHDIILYALPNALWTLSYVLLISYTLRNESRRNRILTAAVIPAIGICFELLQLVGIIPGTFDVLDLLAFVIPYFVIFI